MEAKILKIKSKINALTEEARKYVLENDFISASHNRAIISGLEYALKIMLE